MLCLRDQQSVFCKKKKNYIIAFWIDLATLYSSVFFNLESWSPRQTLLRLHFTHCLSCIVGLLLLLTSRQGKASYFSHQDETRQEQVDYDSLSRDSTGWCRWEIERVQDRAPPPGSCLQLANHNMCRSSYLEAFFKLFNGILVKWKKGKKRISHPTSFLYSSGRFSLHLQHQPYITSFGWPV